MKEKNTIKITKIVINEATFHNEIFEPTNINFCFGKNGSGKSTIGRVIQNNGSNISWKSINDATTTVIQVFNEEYIEKNIKSIDGLPGVFSISEKDVEVENKIKEETTLLTELTAKKEDLDKSASNLYKQLETIKKDILDKCWSKSAIFRERYGHFQFPSTKQRLLDFITDKKIAAQDIPDKDLDRLYDIAFSQSLKTYSSLKELPPVNTVPSSHLMKETLITKNETQFAIFMKNIEAFDWVREGYLTVLPKSESKCPFCQRELNTTIIKNISDCFSDAFEQSIQEIKNLLKKYEALQKEINNIISLNKKELYPNAEVGYLRTIEDVLCEKIKNNIGVIKDKITHPSKVYAIEDITADIEKYNNEVLRLNQNIESYNEIVRNQKAKEEFKAKVKARLAFYFSDAIENYFSQKETLETSYKEIDKEREDVAAKTKGCKAILKELTKHITSTKPVIDSINALLESSGFQGFSIAESGNNKYKLVRDNGEIAYRLSEGEKNFICFLYFYFSIYGNNEESQTHEDRIIVIDDPVSSMDSDTVFVISCLIRNLIEAVKNAYTCYPDDTLPTYIKQVFILTHNAFFFSELAPLYINDYNCVSYYEIKKEQNTSSITLCQKVENKGAVNESYKNFVPKLGSYSALWEEYKEAKSPSVLMSVMRRIIEAYFLQNLYITPNQLYKVILDKKSECFIVNDGEKKDYTEQIIVKSLLSFLISSTNGINSSLYFSLPTEDLTKYRKVFEKIFDFMGQKSHYQMMMNLT